MGKSKTNIHESNEPLPLWLARVELNIGCCVSTLRLTGVWVERFDWVCFSFSTLCLL